MSDLNTPSSDLRAASVSASPPTVPRAPGQGYRLRIAIVVAGITGATAGLRLVAGGGALAETLAHALVYSACIAVLAGLIVPAVRHRAGTMGAIAEWAVTLAGLGVVAVVGTALGAIVLGGLGYGAGEPLAQRFRASFEMNALITAIIGIAMTVYEGQRARLQALTLELRTQELERERDRKAALEARLASLESRLHPHFLFNTLNAISALIHEDPDRAERTVERLAVLLRAALDATGQGTVPLAQELGIVGDYLEIEKTRFGDRLTYELDVAADAREDQLPPLTIQTLVENSIRHSIAPRPAGGRVRIEAHARDSTLTVAVWDDGPGFSLGSATPGHGLENLESRLAALFGDAASLRVARRDGGTLVTGAVPRRPGA